MAKTSPATSSRGLSKSPKQAIKSSPLRTVQSTSQKAEPEQPKPLDPPPRPDQPAGNTPDYFSNQVGGSLSLEPNPFEQSFGGAPSETPNGTKLPSVAALTSPSSLLPGGGSTPFNWGGGSLRTGPLSPAMLSGPANDYFGDTQLRGGFPTPNESSLRTGLTPGGSGSMFPAGSPTTSAVFAQLQSGDATPGTLDFHRTAIAAAQSKRDQQRPSGAPQVTPTSVPQLPPDVPASTASAANAQKPEAKTFDQDSNAANSLYLLAQGRGSAQPQAPFVAPPPPQTMAAGATAPPTLPQQSAVAIPTPVPIPTIPGRAPVQQGRPAHGGPSMANGSSGTAGVEQAGARTGRSSSEAGSAASDESEPARPNARGKGKRNSAGEAGTTANARRRAQDSHAKNGPANKKAKTSNSVSTNEDMYMDSQSDDDDDDTKPGKDGQPKQKMTDEEKRKNFLERNRVAALKCRQRKKQWLQNLQTKVELYSTENENLSSQINQLREEVVNLKTLLLAHKDCPITQQQGLHGSAYIQQSIESFNPQMNPYGMGAPIANQAVIAGQVNSRRYS